MNSMMSDAGEPGGTHGMQEKMASMMQGCSDQQMPEMMLGKMMPNCIEMMLPQINPAKRGEVAASILAALIETGAAGMSDGQRKDYLGALAGVLEESN